MSKGETGADHRGADAATLAGGVRGMGSPVGLTQPRSPGVEPRSAATWIRRCEKEPQNVEGETGDRITVGLTPPRSPETGLPWG